MMDVSQTADHAGSLAKLGHAIGPDVLGPQRVPALVGTQVGQGVAAIDREQTALFTGLHRVEGITAQDHEGGIVEGDLRVELQPHRRPDRARLPGAIGGELIQQ